MSDKSRGPSADTCQSTRHKPSRYWQLVGRPQGGRPGESFLDLFKKESIR
jgi:hypothetical protein